MPLVRESHRLVVFFKPKSRISKGASHSHASDCPWRTLNYRATSGVRCGRRGDRAVLSHRLSTFRGRRCGWQKILGWHFVSTAHLGSVALHSHGDLQRYTKSQCLTTRYRRWCLLESKRNPKSLWACEKMVCCPNIHTTSAAHSLTFTGKQWHEQKKAFRPTKGLTTFEKRAKERAAMAQMKAKEKEMKDEKEQARKVHIDGAENAPASFALTTSFL